MKYSSEPLFPYADGKYFVMPAGLPKNFYPEEPERMHKIDDYIICFSADISVDIKERLIKDYTEYYKKKWSSSIFYI